MTPLEKLSPKNFLSVCDVAMDIKEKLQMIAGNVVVIPLVRTIIRSTPFNILVPAKSVEILDGYSDLRFAAMNYLKEEGIEQIKLLEALQRWDNKAELIIDRKKFDAFYTRLENAYQKRVVDPADEVDRGLKKSIDIEFDSQSGVLRYGNLIPISFQKGRNGTKPRLRLFRKLWEERRCITKGVVSKEGESFPASALASQMNITENAIFELAKGINRALKKKKFPVSIERKNGILLIVRE